MIRLCVLIWALLLGSGQAAEPRILSLNLCTDQLVLALMPVREILGVSRLARDAAISVQVEKARQVAAVNASPEALLALSPDVVFMGDNQQLYLQRWLSAHGVTVQAMTDGDSLLHLRRQIVDMAAMLQRDAAGRVMLQAQDEAFATYAAAARNLRIAVYYPNGFSEGQGGWLGDLIVRLGGINAAAEKGDGQLHLSLEGILSLRPDMILMPVYAYGMTSQAERLALHPALSRTAKVVPLPGAWFTCPHTALASLTEAIGQAALDFRAHSR